MKDYFDLSQLPVLREDVRTLQSSSFDRKTENGDFGQFLYEDSDGACVMFDETGSGCIKSIWAAVVTDESIISFYFDGESTPRWETTLRGLFTGAVPELCGVGNTLEERGHYDGADCVAGNCFIPIPYKNGLKITARGKTDFYYHLLYEKYPENYALSDGDGRVTDNYLGAFEGKRKIPPCTKTLEETVTLDHMYTTVYSSQDAEVIREFTVEVPCGTDISKLCLDISFDGEVVSQVAAPLSHLFAMPLGFTEVHTHAVDTRVENGREVMSLYLPMPYWKSAAICLVNQAEEPAELTLKLKFSHNGYDKKHTGYFCTDYREGLTELFGDWLIGEFYGRGNIVGVVQTCHGGQYCEGNEHFYINGAMTPQINGTGTEDFYLACYWPNLKFDSPCAGCVNDVYLMNDSTLKGSFKYPAGYYRFLHEMPISYVNGIRLCIQHGAVCQTYSDYSSLCFSYRIKESLFSETDIINLESEASAALHGYRSESGSAHYLESKPEGDRIVPILRRSGFIHRDGKLAFTAVISPDNGGVCLRRLYDQNLSPQAGIVYVNGKKVGKWYNPGYNKHTSFADSDFYIPAEYTEGSGTLNIEIEVCGVFTDFEYRVFTIKKV